ncbi:hypothetical protein [Haladaptatus sp. T7]|uniref:hypothetical protein n=1 Tax=Haladaptatus sp. T7 TaxID=2029368 RepID=UPI0021A2527F|nr:hypothetical protein [Haladaptatus sp. T7]GKZ12124.1 hypothetical protein HAL_00050 [Haladaptatus sp. T7]
MRRRDALQQFGLVAALASTGGCAAILGGRGGNQDDGDRSRAGNLESLKIRPKKGDDGNLVVVVTIQNHGDSEESAELEVTADLNDVVHEMNPTVTVPGKETKDVEVPFEVTYEKYSEASSTSISINLK